MIEIHLKPGKDVLVVKTSGLVRANDYAEAMPEFQKAVAETAPKGLLLDWTELDVPVRRFSTGDRAAAEAWLEAVV
jgi:hypothetical protein